MGAWGYRLFPSDNELDLMAEISAEACNMTNDPSFTL